jgi:hypothetical protein
LIEALFESIPGRSWRKKQRKAIKKDAKSLKRKSPNRL